MLCLNAEMAGFGPPAAAGFAVVAFNTTGKRGECEGGKEMGEVSLVQIEQECGFSFHPVPPPK
jgi:hypothetical protein